ncbi:ABC-3 protein [Herpetosiphon aurantiacus DSM 785]|uniref:ABC-3 protein n=1 Tax=Herpetosiphon aurantiacus (strain ATCC 23779 / DSM 785 / 114-95) TaxID=316274 RepID=A9AW57_HERA2|nr:ABC-3 protein [Herpetosiphon aurantiacus DSM 785]
MDWLIEPLRYTFFLRGMVVGMLMGLTCGVLGCFVVLRGMAFIGDALAHAVLPGVVLAYMGGISMVLGALGAGLFAALLISLISRTDYIREDTAIGIVFTGAFALGIVLLSRMRGYARDLTHFLFGNILGIAPSDLLLTGLVTASVLGAIGLWYRPLMIMTFDPTHAKAIGLRLGRWHAGLMVLLALTIVSGIQAVGVVLVAALLVTPAATARLLTNRLPTMIGLAALFGSSSAILGLYASYMLSIASGGVVVLASTGVFAVVFLLAPTHGIVSRRIRQWWPRFTQTPDVITNEANSETGIDPGD